MKEILVITICLLKSIVSLMAQVTPEKLDQALDSKQQMETSGFSNWQKLRGLYNQTRDSSLWINASGERNRTTLIQLLGRSENLGLDEKDYQYDFIRSFSEGTFSLANIEDSIETELKFSDAALHFFSDLAYGNISPAFGYDGLNFSPGSYDIPALIAKYAAINQLSEFFDQLTNSLPQITAIRKKLEIIHKLIREDIADDQRITSTQVNHLNKPLLKKLYLLGISDSLDKRSDILIKNDVIEAQHQFNLPVDGSLHPGTITELNVSLEIRIRQLNLAINYYRWLSCLSQDNSVVVVNIPAAYLKVYGPNNILLEMKVIVGKPSTPTPTLTSRITEVVLYPYWKVPHSIATKELLPAIKRNPGFIDANNFQVISSTGKIADPYKIDWQSLDASNFPYTIRQSTGCDNALGLIKLNFYNPVGVYLHDTPDKSLFSFNRRYFSHGCMRMEKPMDLGHLILNNNSIAIDTLEVKGCLRNQAPVTVEADEKMPVVVWYSPVDVDATGRVIFYEDIYKKFIDKNPVASSTKFR